MKQIAELHRAVFKYVLFFFTMIMFLSCNKDNDFPTCYEHFIFGSYACECAGQCAWLYQLTNDELVIGDGESCMPDHYTYAGTPLSKDKFEIAHRVVDELPDTLLENSEDRFGCPDCHDQGGYYLELRTKSSTRKWSIDTDADDLPEFLMDYQKTIHDVLIALQ